MPRIVKGLDTKAMDKAEEAAVADLGRQHVDEHPARGYHDLKEDSVVRPEPLMQHLARPCDVEAGLQLIELCRKGNLSAVMQRIHAGAPAGFVTSSGWTPVAAAAYSGENDVLVDLLDLGAATMYKTAAKKARDNTPLHWACYKGHADTVAILLTAGYDLEAADAGGNRCLHLACMGGHDEIVQQLLAQSASVKPRNQVGNRALDLATELDCRRLLTRFQAQAACDYCNESFNGLRRPCLCQQCHHIYCTTTPCSSISTVSIRFPLKGITAARPVASIVPFRARTLRLCQNCTVAVGNAERNLRNVLDSTRDLVDCAIAMLDPTGDRMRCLPAASTSVWTEDVKDSDGKEQSLSNVNQGKAVVKMAIELVPEGTASMSHDSPESERMRPDGLETSEESREPRFPPSRMRRRLLSTDTMLRALTLTHADVESLATTLKAAQLQAADKELLRVAQQRYQQLVAHVALQDQVKALLAVRPIAVRSLVEPLKRAWHHATQEHVHPVMRSMAIQVIQSAEAECTLCGCYALCEQIAQGSRCHGTNIARLEASLVEAQQRGSCDTLLVVATALRDRLVADVRLEASLLPFQAVAASLKPEGGQYVFSDGTVRDTLLQALDYHRHLVATAIAVSSSVEGVSMLLLETATKLWKRLNKDACDESKAQDDRRQAEEEAALKAAKKSKRKKKRKPA